jgi:glycerate kinase
VRIVVAPDKFKGSLSAKDAAQAIARGMARAIPDASFDLVPVADGGDGTAQTLVAALGGRMISREVHGPDGKLVNASYGQLSGGSLAVIELAQASGLALLPSGTNDPLTATTYGTGELIGNAIERGARRIILAIGGSATNDAGVGALTALGAVFTDAEGRPLSPGGEALSSLANIDTTALHKRLTGVTIEIASDVRNPLCGPGGASAVYGPQKGASPKDVRTLDDALRHFADVTAAATGVDVRDVPGAGAAGGVGAGFLAVSGALLRPGAELVLEVLDFDRHLSGADIVVTGEGKLDRQTLVGKAPYAVAQAARARGVPTVAIAGAIECSAAELDEAGIACAIPAVPGPMSVEEAMQRSEDLVTAASEMLARALRLRLSR